MEVSPNMVQQGSSKHGECCEATFSLFLEPTLMFKHHHSEDQGISFLLLPSLHFEIFPLRSPGLFRQNFCSTTFAQPVFNNTHSEWTFASAYASLSPPASSSSPALVVVGLIFETEHKSSYCLKEPSLSLIRSGGVSALANSVDNRDQSERLLQTDSIARVEGHQHFSILMTKAYMSVR